MSEAQLYNKSTLSALTETLDEVRSAVADGCVLVARIGPRIVVAARGVRDGRDCEIARLVVAPDMQRRSIGAALIDAVERTTTGDVRRFRLHTGERGAANLRLYQQAGYMVTHSRQVFDDLSLVYLEKLVHV